MQWPDDILQLVWKKVRTDIHPHLKARLWRDIHEDILWENEHPCKWNNEYEWIEGFGVPPSEQELKNRDGHSPLFYELQRVHTRLTQKVVIFH